MGEFSELNEVNQRIVRELWLDRVRMHTETALHKGCPKNLISCAMKKR